MRALTLRQAQNCENARHKRCRCRCGGKLHGAGRIRGEPDRAAFENLPDGDPHKLPPPKRRVRVGRQNPQIDLEEQIRGEV